MTLHGNRILVTGATGQVAMPVAIGLARDNHVVGIARFKDAALRAQLEAAGVQCISVDLARGEFDDVPNDFDYVCNFGVVKSNKWETDIAGNAEAVGLLMAHCRDARAFLHCSSTGVYEAADGSPQRETDPLGDNHRVMMPTYSISKIAAEAVVRTVARLHGVPVTIARLNVPYGDTTGMPTMQLEAILAGEPVVVHPEFPDVFAPIHLDDMVRTLPALLGAATVPATIVNWGGDEPVGVVEWSEHMAALLGREAVIVRSEGAIKGMCPDVTVLRELVGGPVCTIGWREGMRRMVEAATATAR